MVFKIFIGEANRDFCEGNVNNAFLHVFSSSCLLFCNMGVFQAKGNKVCVCVSFG